MILHDCVFKVGGTNAQMRESKLDITLENRNKSNIFALEILIHEIITQNLNYKLIL